LVELRVMTDQAFPGVLRSALIERKLVRQGWLVVVLGFVVPVLGLWAAANGRRLLRAGNPHGWPLVVLGLAVFAVRLGLYGTGSWPN
jgi:hypothetical protein